jgi:hypothetical protein
VTAASSLRDSPKGMLAAAAGKDAESQASACNLRDR